MFLSAESLLPPAGLATLFAFYNYPRVLRNYTPPKDARCRRNWTLLGLLGAALALAKPRAAAAIMLVAALGITVSISLFAVIAAPLLLIAAILAFLGRQKGDERIVIQTEATGTGGSDGPPRVR